MLRSVELLLLVGVIISPVVYYSTSLSIFERHAKVGLREGDIIHLTITEYSFDYNLTYIGNYNVTAGLYLSPAFEFKEGVTYTSDNLTKALSTIKLIEGNISSQLQFNFLIDTVGETKIGAIVTFENTSKIFTLGVFSAWGIIPFLEPCLAIGLTFSTDDGITKTSYVHWRNVFLFSTKRAREALNWHSRNTFSPPHDFAREDKNTFNAIVLGQNFISASTYKLYERTSRLKGVESTFKGIESLRYTMIPFSSNITYRSGIPETSYWNYHLEFELRYFRGGKEI